MTQQSEKLKVFQEVANRGMQDSLPDNQRAIFDELVNRGLITTTLADRNQAIEQLAQAQASGDVMGQDLAVQALNQSPMQPQQQPQFVPPPNYSDQIKRSMASAIDESKVSPLEALWKGVKAEFGRTGLGILQRTGLDDVVFDDPEMARRFMEAEVAPAAEQRPIATGTGEVLATAAEFAPAFASAPATVPMFAAEGALYGATRPQEEGAGALDVAGTTAKEAAIGAVGGKIGQTIIDKALAPASRFIMSKLGFQPTKPPIDANGVPSDEFEQALQTSGTDLDAFLSSQGLDAGPDVDFQRLTEALKNQDQAALVNLIQADPDIIAAAKDLGVVIDPGLYSTNQSFQEFTKQLKALPESALKMQEDRMMASLYGSADNTLSKAQELIEQFGGDLDPSALSSQFRQDMIQTVDDMAGQAEQLYGQVGQYIPKATQVDPSNTLEFLNTYITDMGGIDKVKPAIRRLFEGLSDGNTTYAFLDSQRKEIGEALAKGMNRKGQFKDEQTALLNTIYGSLAEDQKGAVTFIEEVIRGQNPDFDVPLSDIYQQGIDVVKTRKDLEARLTAALGKELEAPLMNVVRKGVQGLTKGDIRAFNTAMNAVPDDMKSMVAVTALDGLVKQPSGTAFSPAALVKNMNGLLQNKEAAELFFKHLPQGAKQRLTSLYKISDALQRYNITDPRNPSGTAAQSHRIEQVIKMMQDPEGWLTKLSRPAMTAGIAEAALPTGGATGAVVGSVSGIGELLRARKGTQSEAVTTMLSSPEFLNAIIKHTEGDESAANTIAGAIPSVKRWLADQPQTVTNDIMQQGFMSWLMSSDIGMSDDQTSNNE